MLVPVDAAGRVLELLLVLEAAWAAGRPGYGLALLSPVAFNALEFAKSQLEWMAEGLTHALESRKANPFALRCVRGAPAPGTVGRATAQLKTQGQLGTSEQHRKEGRGACVAPQMEQEHAQSCHPELAAARPKAASALLGVFGSLRAHGLLEAQPRPADAQPASARHTRRGRRLR